MIVNRTRLVVAMLVSAFVLGIAGDSLLRVGPWGYNVVAWVGLLLVLIYALGESYKTEYFKNVKWLAVPLILFSTGLAIRDSVELRFLNILGIVATLGIVMMRSNSGGYLRASVSDYLLNWIGHWCLALARFFYIFGQDVSWKEVTHTEHGDRYKSIARGLLIALPLLCVFGGLMVSADVVFKKYTVDFIHLDTERVLTAFILIPLFTWIGGSILRQLLIATAPSPPVIRPEGFKLGRIEVGIVFSTIVTLFLGFIFVQFGYFFGGNKHVLSTIGVTYAEYARSGFFELVTVCGIAIIVILSLQALSHQKEPETKKMFTVMSSLFIGELLIVLVSASQRMNLYINAYGMSVLRYYVAVVIVWLAVVMLWLAITQITNRSRHFAFGALFAIFACVWISVILNPDRMVADYNLRYSKKIDMGYLCSLSADAAPTIVNYLKNMKGDKQTKAAGMLLNKWPNTEFQDWRTMNLGKHDASWVLYDNMKQLREWAKDYKPDRSSETNRAIDREEP